jgi:hypothetical protein
MSINAEEGGQNKPIVFSNEVIDGLTLLGIDNLTLRGTEKLFENKRRSLLQSFNHRWEQFLGESKRASVKELAVMMENKLEKSPCSIPDELMQVVQRIIRNCLANGDLIKLIQTHDFLFERDVEIISTHQRIIKYFE